MKVGDLVKVKPSPWVFRSTDIGIIYNKTSTCVHVNWFEWGSIRYSIGTTEDELEVISS